MNVVQLGNRSGLDRRLSRDSGFMEQRRGIDRRGVVRDAERIVSIMNAIPLFKGFSQDQYLQFLRICSRGVVPRGKMLIRKGEKPDAMYIVISGRIKLLFAEHAELTMVEPFGIIGEVDVITGEPRVVSAAADKESVVLRIGARELMRVLTRDDRHAWQLLTNMIHGLAHKLRDERKLLESSRFRRILHTGIV